MTDVKAHTKYDICKQCKGVCCTTYAGIYSPDDFLPDDLTVEGLIKLLLTEKYTIDSDDADIVFDIAFSSQHFNPQEKVYCVRPRHMDEPAIQKYAYRGVCVNWSYDNGCSLTEEKRPYMCRMLVPLRNDGEYCSHNPEDKADKISMLKRWIPYQKILKNSINIYMDLKKDLSDDEFNKPVNIFRYLDRIKKLKLGVINGQKTLG